MSDLGFSIFMVIAWFGIGWMIGHGPQPEPDTTEVIIHAEQGIICEVDEFSEIWCSLTPQQEE